MGFRCIQSTTPAVPTLAATAVVFILLLGNNPVHSFSNSRCNKNIITHSTITAKSYNANTNNIRSSINSSHEKIRCRMSNNEHDDDKISSNEKNDNNYFDKKNLSSEEQKQKWEFRIDDDVLVLGDIMSLTICCLILGLLNVVDSPVFAEVGGWAAPIPPVPSTVGATITKASHMGVSWLLAGIYNISFTYSAVSDRSSIVKSILSTWVTFCSIEVILAICLAAVADFDGTSRAVDSIALFRSLLAVLPGLFTWRILFSKRMNGYF